MGKKLKTWAMTSLAASLVAVAQFVVIGPNSIFAWYEPDIPESLKR